MRLTKILLSGLFLSSVCWAENILPVCGGDGPMPLPNKVNTQLDKIQTKGVAQEFVIWENSGTFVYRNEKGDVFFSAISGGNGGKKFTKAPAPLFHLPDPQERFLTTRVNNWFVDTNGGQWVRYNTVVPSMEPIFWRGNDMYAVATTYDLTGSVFRLYRYHASDKYVTPLCDNVVFNASNGYRLASGHSYPYVYLYQAKTLSSGTVFSMLRLNADNCDVEDLPNTKMLVQGRVENVYRFEKLDALAIKVDAPSRNLLWKQGNAGCQYFDVGDSQVLLANRDLPVLASYNSYSPGVTLYDFRAVEKQVYTTTVLAEPASPVYGIGAHDLYLSKDGRSLFVRTGANREGSSIMRVRFKGFLSDN